LNKNAVHITHVLLADVHVEDVRVADDLHGLEADDCDLAVREGLVE